MKNEEEHSSPWKQSTLTIEMMFLKPFFKCQQRPVLIRKVSVPTAGQEIFGLQEKSVL